MKVLVTGCAGFIGFHLCSRLANENILVHGLDNLNSYYDVQLKKNRLKILKDLENFKFYKLDLKDNLKLKQLFKKNKYHIVINLAAQAGVRYSITNPKTYFDSNILGFYNLINNLVNSDVKHFLFASTSSVYGSCNKFPIKEDYNTDNPLSFYAASKKINETIAYSYSNIHKIPTTGLRFFTVYGPFGRPDMSIFKFTNKILKNKEIELYNKGNHYRDFTYIDDIIEAIFRLLDKSPKSNPPFNIFNIGGGNDIYLKNLVKLIEKNLNKKAKIKNLPLQLGDIKKTHSDITKLNSYSGYNPKISIEVGIKKFIDWYKEYYKY